MSLFCVGEGPVLSISTPELNFGDINVLERNTLPLVLTNESNIAANFECILDRAVSLQKLIPYQDFVLTCDLDSMILIIFPSLQQSVYKVTPRTGTIEPKRKLELEVSVYLNDNVRFGDLLSILVQDSSSHTVTLAAVGQGPTIVSTPEISPIMDLGPLFSARPVSYRFQLHNKGRRRQVLYWTVDGIKPVKRHNVKSSMVCLVCCSPISIKCIDIFTQKIMDL